MTKVIATAEVEDVAKWESGFKTHSELFVSQTVNSPISYSCDAESSQVVICFEVNDLDAYLKEMESPATAEAMASDGVKRETVNLIVLDKEFAF